MRPRGIRHCYCWLGVLALAGSVPGQSTRPADATPAGTQPATTRSAITATRPGSSAVDPQVILQQLASTDWHERKAAIESLVRLGEAGKPFIEELVRTAAIAEARNNAQAALAQIDTNRVSGPSYITLHLKNATPAQTIAQLAPQTFSSLPTMPDNLWQQQGFGVVNIDVDHVPFWEVAPKICQQLGVDFRPFQNNLRIARGGQIQGLSHVEGAFLIVANQLNYTRTRTLGAGNQQTRFGMTMSVYPEPKITVLSGGGNVRIDEAVDEHGNSLVPRQNRTPAFYGGYSGGFNLYANLQYPTKNPGARIVRFRASTKFLVQTRMRDFVVDNPADVHDVSTNVDGVQVTFRELKAKDDFYEVRMSVPQSIMQSPQFQTLQAQFQTRLRLLDAQGNELDHRGMGTNMDGASFDFDLQFVRNNRRTPNGKPTKLVWEIPLESREITVPIRFDNIPLFDDN